MNKTQRAELKGRYGGLCSYCGCVLSEKWHADHLQPLRREGQWKKQAGGQMKYISTGKVQFPERDHPGNLYPACVPCNVDKSDLPLEVWRKRLLQSADVLHRNYSTFRHATRFNLIQVKPKSLLFHFERRRLL